MTRRETRSYGMVTPPHIQPLLDAALRALLWLVSNLGSRLGLLFNRRTRDWHTDVAHEGPLRASHNQLEKESTSPSTQGTTQYSLASNNRDARHKAEHDTAEGEASGSVEHAFPAEAGIQPARDARSQHAHFSPVIPAAARERVEREPRSRVHDLSFTPLASGSRALILSLSKDARVRNDNVCMLEISLT